MTAVGVAELPVEKSPVFTCGEGLGDGRSAAIVGKVGRGLTTCGFTSGRSGLRTGTSIFGGSSLATSGGLGTGLGFIAASSFGGTRCGVWFTGGGGAIEIAMYSRLGTRTEGWTRPT